MTDTNPAPQQPSPATPPEPARHGFHDALMLIALLGTCTGVYLAVGATAFTGVVSAVVGLYGTWRTRR
ncbi:hypothetical protein [Streptomyces goshikiensis]|uniref:hypothetical protein n=1 Tax=Streptomyces goshikiensis TaxID=1942 RepID=UPI002ADF16A4|nr:hypothetical protein [Streptomyces goshikiensis]